MAKYTHDVIIIGGGAGGLVATVGCSRLGLKTAVIEKHKGLGGDCLFHGCVPSKTLLKSASVYHHAASFPKYGLPSVKLPPANLATVNKRVQSVIATIAKHDAPARFEKMGAEVYTSSEARFVSEHEVSIGGGKTISAPKIVIATGTSPLILPIPGIKETGFITNLDVFSLKKLPQHLIVIGAGPIGIEMSQAFSRLGSKVSILDIANHILIKDDPDMTAVVAESLSASGARFIGGIKILGTADKNGKKVITYEKNGKQEKISGDMILLGAGRKGNADSLQCQNAGVELNRSFIPTNNKLQTTQKHIYAIGDSNGKFLFTHVAAAEASVVIRRIALRAGGKIDYRAVPWVTYTDPEIASIGHNEVSAAADRIDYHTIVKGFEHNDRALAEEAPEGKMKILLDRSEQVIGVQIVGLHAGDLILPAVFAINQKWKAKTFLSPIYPYPTMGDLYKGAVGEYIAPKLFNNTVRTILRLLHGYRGKRTG